MSIRILLLGSGGREHALAWKLSQSQLLDHLYVCPGNGGTAQEPKTSNIDLSMNDFPRLVEFALKNEVYVVDPLML
jgi:phosphoribosylamine--glycine ligase/phosphoribosylformylglycinamidine cyclo-ligase